MILFRMSGGRIEDVWDNFVGSGLAMQLDLFKQLCPANTFHVDCFTKRLIPQAECNCLRQK